MTREDRLTVSVLLSSVLGVAAALAAVAIVFGWWSPPLQVVGVVAFMAYSGSSLASARHDAKKAGLDV